MFVESRQWISTVDIGHYGTGFYYSLLFRFVSARPRSAEYTIGICFETAKNTKAFECFFTGFQHSLWKFSTTGNLYSLKPWLWLAAVACVVSLPISNALLNDIWLTCFTRMWAEIHKYYEECDWSKKWAEGLQKILIWKVFTDWT